MNSKCVVYKDTNLFSDSQCASRKGRKCKDHIFTLKGICFIRKSEKLKTSLN